MICKEVHKRINSYLNDQLTKVESLDFELHLEGCASCRNIINEVKQTLELANEKNQISANPFMFTRIQQQIINHDNKSTGVWQRVLQPIAAVAIIVIGLSAGIGLGTKYYNDNANYVVESSETDSQLSNDKIYLDAIAYESIESFLLTE
jgi:predicted anti-sigma-YlaC factor YlaD